MRDYPLLDLKSAWQDAQHCLQQVRDMAGKLYADSEQTWDDMVTIRDQVTKALNTLAVLPPGILEGIAKDEADLAEMEDRADASSY